jgi:hypothetical protein
LGVIHAMEDDITLPTAALRDFSPVYDRFGSIATEEVEATRPCTSASPQKRTNRQTFH